jgi:membrane protease subunit (stomatin/prohibitin family)
MSNGDLRPVIYGHWISKKRLFTRKEYLECSKCGCAVDPNYISVYPEFCPGCGADMRWYD